MLEYMSYRLGVLVVMRLLNRQIRGKTQHAKSRFNYGKICGYSNAKAISDVKGCINY